MGRKSEVVSWEQFALYAGDDEERWKELERGRVKHARRGWGRIARVDGSRKYFWVDFKDGRGGAYKIDVTSQGEFRTEKHFSDIQVPKKLKRKVVDAEDRLERQRKEEIRRRSQEARRIEQLRAPLKPFIEASDQALRNEVRAAIRTPRLDAQDIELALEWCSPEVRNEVTPDNIHDKAIQERHRAELSRALSARAAEKAAIAFYQDYGCAVEDISITQIAREANRDWVDYDLRVDGEPVDVKNSRRSKRSIYVRHCVPQFKRDRVNQEVIVAGVLSWYLKPGSILNPEEVSGPTFLGTTTSRTIEALEQKFEIPGFFQIDLSRAGVSGQFLPPWMFDCPDSVYKRRDCALAKASRASVPGYGACQELEVNLIPICIAAGIDLQEHWGGESLAGWEWSFVRRVLSWRRNYGLSLPFLFLTLMTHFLEMVSSPANETEGYHPRKYRKLLYHTVEHGVDRTRPLFIYDPIKTVWNLVDALSTLWCAEHRLIRSFQVFELQGPNILRGRVDAAGEQWKTLIAHCGGCGKNPLILGMAQHCECGRLICPRCGFCFENCPSYRKRQSSTSSS
jgi:hypothetical protein